MWWRVAILALGVAGFGVALWHDRFGFAFFLFVVLCVLAYLLRQPQKTQEGAAGIERPRKPSNGPGETRVRATETQPAISGSPEAAITLWAANEPNARQLLDDQYFLMGVLMSETSDAVTRFLDVLGQGGALSGQVTPNPIRGGYDVNIKVRKAQQAGAESGDCPYCGAVLNKDGSGARIKLDRSGSRPGEQGFFCPECGHELDRADIEKLEAGVLTPPPPPPADPGAYTGPPIADLSQADLVEELVKAGVSRESAEANVQVSIVMATTLDAAQIRAIQSSDRTLMVKDLAMRWAVHCVAHGAKPRAD